MDGYLLPIIKKNFKKNSLLLNVNMIWYTHSTFYKNEGVLIHGDTFLFCQASAIQITWEGRN